MGWDYVGSTTPSGSASTNFRADTTLGLSAAALLRTTTPLAQGLAATAVARLLTPVTAGLSIATSATGTVRATATLGIGAATVLTTTPAVNLGAEMVQVKYDLVRNAPSTATSTGTQAWPNVANASGLANGTVATAQGDTLNTRSYSMRLTYPAAVNKDSLTITGVTLRTYQSFNMGLTGNTYRARVFTTAGALVYDSGAITTGSSDNLTTPSTQNLFALGVNTWAKVSDLVVQFDFATAVAATTATCSIDAAEVVVTATRTDLL